MDAALVMVNLVTTHRSFRRFRLLMLVLLVAGSFVAPTAASGAELKPEALREWDSYVKSASLQTGAPAPFLWIDQVPDRRNRVRAGEILVESVGHQNPKPVPSGLIHDWIGAAFVPNASVNDILSTVRDYDDYKNVYKPTVVDSKLIATDGSCDKYSLRVVNKEIVAETALDMEYEACYVQVDERRWYGTMRATQVREIRHYGKPDAEELPPDQGSGYIWRFYGVARFEQRDGGTYVEVEAIALSRDVPVALRWIVSPIVRRVSRNSMVLSLQQTGDAVRSTKVAQKNSAKPGGNVGALALRKPVEANR